MKNQEKYIINKQISEYILTTGKNIISSLWSLEGDYYNETK